MTDSTLALLLAAWLTGLAGGGGHCLAMCGGIVGMIGVRQTPGLRGYLTLAAAHLGRVGGYATAGAIAGFVGAAAVGVPFGARGLVALRVVAAALVLAVGLQLLLGRPLLRGVERQGAKLWRHVAPRLRGLLPPRDPVRALAVGAVWGFLPCGLVYAQLTIAAASGGALTGTLVMGAFGLGTIVSLSALSTLLQALGLGRLPRRTSGALLLAFGLWMLVPLALPGHHAGTYPPSHHEHATE